MKIKLLTSILFLQVIVSAQQNNIDVLHYKFHIGLNDLNDTIQGAAEIKVKFLNTTDQLSFDLTFIDDQGKGMKIDKIEGTIVKVTVQVKNKIRIINSKSFHAGDTATFIIIYHGIPADGLIISKTKYGHRSFFADNWPDRGHNWLPCHEDPADKATVEFLVTAPDHYQVVANGIQIEESSLLNGNKLTHWKEETPISTKVMVIGVADFAVNLAGYVNDQIPIYSWVYPEDKDKGFYDYALAKDILPFFINHVGRYGYKKLANVQSKTKFGGLENANTIFYSENSIKGTRENESLLVHEIAHQWFGNMATEKSFGHLWLSEGFATYFTILYFENKYGRDTIVNMLKQNREEVIDYSKKSDNPVVDLLQTDYMKLLNANSYQKGGWVLHMIRQELGDSVFWKSIRKYYEMYAGGIAGTEDLQKVFEDISGKNLKQFFTQWLYTPGQPELKLNWEYNKTSKTLKATVLQMQKQLFEFPLGIKIIFSDGKFLYKQMSISGQSTSFSVSANQKPTALILDPDVQLLFEESIKK